MRVGRRSPEWVAGVGRRRGRTGPGACGEGGMEPAGRKEALCSGRGRGGARGEGGVVGFGPREGSPEMASAAAVGGEP